MDKGLYIAMTGAKNNALAQSAIANNLANVGTNGFHSDFTQARAMPVYYGDGFPSRAYAMTERPGTNFERGPMVDTGRSLDVTVERDGWIALQAPDGRETYTRTADLHIDALGVLRSGRGLPVMGTNGPIVVPPQQSIDVGYDGSVTVRGAGQGAEVLLTVDRIKLVNPDEEQLYKDDDGLIYRRGDGDEPFVTDVSLVSGVLEGSNVNAVEAMTEMLSLARQFETQLQYMRSSERNAESVSKLMRIA